MSTKRPPSTKGAIRIYDRANFAVQMPSRRCMAMVSLNLLQDLWTLKIGLQKYSMGEAAP